MVFLVQRCKMANSPTWNEKVTKKMKKAIQKKESVFFGTAKSYKSIFKVLWEWLLPTS